MITVFTTPKPFTGLADRAQRNALASWRAQGPSVRVILFGDSLGAERVAKDFSIEHIPQVCGNPHGIPRLDSMFRLAQEISEDPYLAYVNCDVLLPDRLDSVTEALGKRPFLAVGRRIDLNVDWEYDGSESARRRLLASVEKHGRIHPPTGSDYFVFPRGTISSMPPFLVGRAGWDNWLIWDSLRRGITVVDATGFFRVVHQDHPPASHSFGNTEAGRRKAEETVENQRFAGEGDTFILEDVPFRLTHGGVRRKISWRIWIRRLNQGYKLSGGKPPAGFGARVLGNLMFATTYGVTAWLKMAWARPARRRRETGVPPASD